MSSALLFRRALSVGKESQYRSKPARQRESEGSLRTPPHVDTTGAGHLELVPTTQGQPSTDGILLLEMLAR